MVGLIVHEWMAESGGSENVVEAIARAIPDADVFCLWNDKPDRLPTRDIRESWLASTPLRRHKALALPLMPFVWRTLRPKQTYDWVLASSHLFAHQAQLATQRDVAKFVYVHTPARYIWTPHLDERGHNRLARASAPFFRKLDRRFAQDSSQIAANSQFVQTRISEAWQRDSTVIYPPVDVTRIQSVDDWTTKLTEREQDLVNALPPNFVLGASRFVPYKRLDAVITVGEANDVPVVLAGAGPDEARLRTLGDHAKIPVSFITSPSNALLYALFERALVYVFPAVEDFGIMPVEAMAVGARVIVNSIGGAGESVLHGETGFHSERFEGRDAKRAVERAVSLPRLKSKDRARAFSAESFSARVTNWIKVPQHDQGDAIGTSPSAQRHSAEAINE